MEMPHPGADAGFQNNKQPTKVTGVAAAAAAGAGAASVDAAAAVPSAAAQEDDECVICLDSKSKSATLAMLKCSHSFCEGCIKGWSKQETTCPLCKQEFKDYKKITQTFSPFTASGTKRKRAQPKETVVKVKKTTQAQQYAQRFAAAGGGGGMHLLGPHLNYGQMMMHIPQIMAIMGGHFPPGQVRAHFIARPGARAPAPAPAAAATATARAAAAAAASSEGRSANNAIVVDAAAGVSSVLRRQGPGTSILQAVRQRPNDPVPPRRPQGPPVVIDLTGDDDNEPVPAAASGRTQSSSSSSSASSSSSSASASASSSSSSAAPARSSSGAARGTQRDQSAELNARIMHVFAMLDNGHGVFGDDDDDSDEFGGDY